MDKTLNAESSIHQVNRLALPFLTTEGECSYLTLSVDMTCKHLLLKHNHCLRMSSRLMIKWLLLMQRVLSLSINVIIIRIDS